MADAPYRFTTHARKITRSGELSWGGERGWAAEINHNNGVDVTDGAVIPDQITAPTTGLIAHFPFNAGTGVDVAGSYDGTIHGASYREDVGSKRDGAFEFNGSSDYINADSAPRTGSQDRTVTAWIYPRSKSSQHHVITNWGTVNTGGKAQFYLHDSGVLRVEIAGDGFTTSFSPPLDTWSFVGYTLNGSTMADYTVYMNGEAEHATGTDEVTVDTDSSNPLHIGKSVSNTGRWWDGLLDEIRIYNRALSASEMGELYAATK